MSEQLKPCPFCGSCNIGSSYIVTYSVDSSYDVFGCKDCGARFENGGADEWNTRTEDAALAAKDARITELEEHCKRLGAGGAERYWEGRWRDADAELSRLRDAATPSEDGGEVPTPIALVRERDWNLEKTLFAVFYANSDPKPGDQLMTVAQCKRIVAAKDAEIARLRELHENAHSAAKTLMAERATLMEQAAHWLEVNAPSGGCIETNIADELRALLGKD